MSSDTPVPERFADYAELDAFIAATGCIYFWRGTQGFTKYQRRYGDRFIVVPITSRRDATTVGIVPAKLVEAEHEAERIHDEQIKRKLFLDWLDRMRAEISEWDFADPAAMAILRLIEAHSQLDDALKPGKYSKQSSAGRTGAARRARAEAVLELLQALLLEKPLKRKRAPKSRADFSTI
jgi:hypothetical protein